MKLTAIWLNLVYSPDMIWSKLKDFLLISLIGSIILTLAVNLLPALFPNAAAKAERKIIEKMQDTQSDRLDPNTPKVRVFFPWKAMLLISLILTIAVNFIGVLAR